MTLTTTPPKDDSRPGRRRWVADVPRQSLAASAVAALAALAMVFSYLVDGGWAGWVEIMIAVVAVASLFLAPARLSSYVSLGSVALLCVVELLAGRYEGGPGWQDAGRPVVLAGILLASSLLRFGIRRRDTELAVASEAIDELTRRDRVVDLLAGGQEPTWLEAELARSQRHHHQLALVLVRPDAFEALAAVGAASGQEVLEAVAEVIGSELRAIDVALRHAPTTFALILPETPIEGARVAAERIRLLLPLRVGTVGGRNITVSLGVASFPDDATTHDELVQCAERALDRAIELGGNRTVCASAPGTAPPGWTMAGAGPR